MAQNAIPDPMVKTTPASKPISQKKQVTTVKTVKAQPKAQQKKPAKFVPKVKTVLKKTKQHDLVDVKTLRVFSDQMVGRRLQLLNGKKKVEARILYRVPLEEVDHFCVQIGTSKDRDYVKVTDVGGSEVVLLEERLPEKPCLVCMDVEASRKARPCGHAVFCASCAPLVLRHDLPRICPLCRLPIARITK
jgi:hypothetical protein